MTIICRLVRFGRRQLHTVVSREFIKPSSPTPFHLKTYNLSLLDQKIVNSFIPIVTFYPNTRIVRSPQDVTIDLKNSLSQTLTNYYPFAGRLVSVAPTYVDCNDHGAEFVEASIDSTLSDFLQNSKHEDLDQFFPRGLVHINSNRRDDVEESDKVIPLAVQINHFECGGLAVAVSLTHKIADASSLVHFLNDWAKMSQICSGNEKHEFPNNPHFISFQNRNLNFMGYSFEASNDSHVITKSFRFTNSKINDLKLKVKAITAKSGQPITNPTRVEVLSWLLYTCAVTAATRNNSGYFKPTGVIYTANIRGGMIEPLPEKTIGNFLMSIKIVTEKETDMKPESYIGELKKQKLQFKGLRNIETVLGLVSVTSMEKTQRNLDKFYICTSYCGYPTYEINFGWGNPVKVTRGGNLRKNSFILLDAPDRCGIDALVCLGKQDMAIIQSDPELISFL